MHWTLEVRPIIDRQTRERNSFRNIVETKRYRRLQRCKIRYTFDSW